MLLNVTRITHLLSMAYVFGQSFTVFIAGPSDLLRHGTFGAAYMLEQFALILILLSGAVTAFVHTQTGKGKFGRQRYGWIVFSKVMIWLLLTPLTDVIALAWVGEKHQTQLSDNELYFVRGLKAVLLMVAFSLGSYSRIYRENITEGFSKMPGQMKPEIT